MHALSTSEVAAARACWHLASHAWLTPLEIRHVGLLLLWAPRRAVVWPERPASERTGQSERCFGTVSVQVGRLLTSSGSIDGRTAQGLRWFARHRCEPHRTPCRRYPESKGHPAGSGRSNLSPEIGCASSSGWRSSHGYCCGLHAPTPQPRHPTAESSGRRREHLASRLAHAFRFQRAARMRRMHRHRRLCACSCRRLQRSRNRRQTSPRSHSVHEVAHV